MRIVHEHAPIPFFLSFVLFTIQPDAGLVRIPPETMALPSVVS